MFCKKKVAFTLIELLVVIAIIGILATIAVVALNNARAKARDAKRVADVKQIQTALDLYYNDKGYYPSETEFAAGSLFSTSSVGTTTYMAMIPTAPVQADGTCTTPQNHFAYNKISDESYTISYCLGGPVGTLAAGPKCASPEGVASVDCSGSGTISGIGSGSNFHCGDNIDYGGQLYPTVPIVTASSTQCWMGKNLNIGTKVDGNRNQADANAGVIEKFCMNNATSSCDTSNQGGMYQWHTAMALPAICDNHFTGTAPCVVNTVHQGICPNDWHVPSDADWHALEFTFANPANNSNCPATLNSWGCNPAGNAFVPGGSSGMALLVWGGAWSLSGGFSSYYDSHFWTTLSDSSIYAWIRQFYTSDNWGRVLGDRSYAYSLRCIHN